MNNLTEDLARFVIDTRWSDLPPEVVRNVKFLFLDSIGCALAGLSVDPGKIAVSLAKSMAGPPEASIIGTNFKVSPLNAAFANGELIRAMDYDAMPTGGHTPPYVLPPALAIAESKGATGRDFILAAAVGFEIAARVSSAVAGGNFTFASTDSNSFIMTERSGGASFNFGAAAGAGKLLDLNLEKMVNALGIAGHLCQVLTNTRFTFGDHRHMPKYGMAGWQNTGGIMAVLLAENGYIGDTTVFGDHGFQVFCGYSGWDPGMITSGLGDRWISARSRYKQYPTCGMIHTSLDCFRTIIDRHNIKPNDIESVTVYDHPVLQTPVFNTGELNCSVDVQFGPHYAMSLAALGVKPGVDWHNMDIVRDPRITEFSRKVKYMVHPDFAKRNLEDPSGHLSKVEVTAGGRTLTEERTHSRGTPVPGYAFTDEEIIDKFRHNASRYLPQVKIDDAVKILLEMEMAEDIKKVIEKITP